VPYVLLHIEAASTEKTKEKHNKTERTTLKRSSFLRNNVPSLLYFNCLSKSLAVDAHYNERRLRAERTRKSPKKQQKRKK